MIAPPDKPWPERFLVALEATGNVCGAARAAGIHRCTAYDHRERDLAFRVSWDQALDVATDALEAEARRRAMGWTETLVDAQGNSKTVLHYSDRLMEILLKAHRPQKYRENVKHEHDGQVSVRVEYADVHGDPAPAPSGATPGPQ